MKQDKVIEVKYLGFKSEYTAPEPLPFGAHKYIRSLRPDKVPYLGTINSTIFEAVLVVDGIEGKPFEYTVTY